MADLNRLGASTLPARLLEAAARWPDVRAVRAKSRGLWRTWSWHEAAGEVRAGSPRPGRRRRRAGDRVAVRGTACA